MTHHPRAVHQMDIKPRWQQPSDVAMKVRQEDILAAAPFLWNATCKTYIFSKLDWNGEEIMNKNSWHINDICYLIYISHWQKEREVDMFHTVAKLEKDPTRIQTTTTTNPVLWMIQ